MKRDILFLSALALLSTIYAGCKTNEKESSFSYTDYVDPKIGSGGHGHVFVGANVPYGMVQLGPTSYPQEWDWTSGYHDSDSTLIGFSHTHLSGTGIGDLFDITVMPVTGEVAYYRGLPKDTVEYKLWHVDRSREITKPGYYSVPINESGILAELTATNRTGLHRYTFPPSDTISIVVDLENGGCWDGTYYSKMEQTGPQSIAGQRLSSGWAYEQKVYFFAEFSEPIQNFTLNGEENMYGRIDFAPSDTTKQILVKVGISPVSVEAAKKNLMEETSSLSFDEIATIASQEWENELGRINIKSEDPEELKKFYTALYHFYFHPSSFNDHGEKPEYTILSLWDTYRAQLPLLSILDEKKNGEIVNSMLDIYDKQGRLPVWHLWGNETDCMVGNPGIIAVADGVVKNLPGVDMERAFKALVATSNDTARGGSLRAKYGYIPVDLKKEAIAWDMEYAIADGAIANAARALNDSLNAKIYDERSHSYKNYFDADTKFMRGKNADGSWRTPFNPSFSSRDNDYCEGNAWQYTWLVPQDIPGLMELFGGKENMIFHLDSLFKASPVMEGDNITPDISGMIGQYVHGNEPSHHIAYIYSMLGEREKTAALVNRIMDEQYSAQPDGLSGNEDCGQMSAWYIFSALGFYPVEPAGGKYWLGTPRFEEAVISLPQNRKFVVRKKDDGNGNVYLNGEKLDRNYITHEEIMTGGELVLP